MGDVIDPITSEVLYQRSRDGPLPSNPLNALKCILNGISLVWEPGPLTCIHNQVVAVTDGSDLEGSRGMAKLGPNSKVKGVVERVVPGNNVRIKIKFEQNFETEVGWVSRDIIHEDETMLVFSCLEYKLENIQNKHFGADYRREIIKQLTIAVLLHVPSQYISIWLDALCCYEEEGEGEQIEKGGSYWDRILKNQDGGGGGICGYLFKRGDMAWNCRTCQSDPTCVQCDACFRASDHTGHDVFFHSTSPGGCCDCGDLEAWADAGCCDKHRQRSQQDKTSENKFSPTIISNTTLVLQNVLNFIIEIRRRSVKGYEEPPGQDKDSTSNAASISSVLLRNLAPRALLSYVSRSVSHTSFDSATSSSRVSTNQEEEEDGNILDEESNAQEGEGTSSQKGNEDVFQNVFGTPNIWLLTSEGEAEEEQVEVADQCDAEEVIVRIFNDDVHTYDEVIECLTEAPFAQQPSIAQQTTLNVDKEGQGLVATLNSARDVSALMAKLQRHGLVASAVPKKLLRAENRLGACLTWMSALSGKSTTLRSLLGRCLCAPIPAVCDGGFPLWRVANNYNTQIIELHEDQSSSRLVLVLPPPSSSSSLNQPPIAFPSTYILLLILSDFFASNQTRQLCHSLWLILTADQDFKHIFGECYFKALSQLNKLYTSGVGCSEDCIFDLNVQLFTTPSLVKKLNDESFLSNILTYQLLNSNKNKEEEGIGNNHLQVMPGLVETMFLCLYESLTSQGNNDNEKKIDFTNRYLVHSRYSHLISGLHYALKSPRASSIFTQNNNSFNVFLKTLSLLHTLEPLERIKEGRPHVETETQVWIAVWNLALPLADLVKETLRDATSTSINTSSNNKSVVLSLLTQALSFLYQTYHSFSGKLNHILYHLKNESEAAPEMSSQIVNFYSFMNDQTNNEVFINYDILKDSIYLHLPLQRFIASLFTQSMEFPPISSSSSLSLNEELVQLLSTIGGGGHKHVLGLVLCEPSLRAFAFSVHAYANLWSRNGHGVMNQAMNYRNPPFCYEFRDFDLKSIQFGSLFLGSNYLCKLSILRFGVYQCCLEEFTHHHQLFLSCLKMYDTDHVKQFFEVTQEAKTRQDVRPDAIANVLAEMLLFFVNLLSEVPYSIDTVKESSSSSNVENGSSNQVPNPHFLEVLSRKVQRALLHVIACAGSAGLKHSKVSDVVHKVCGDDESHIDVKGILSKMCAKNQNKNSQLLYLSEKSSLDYDPSFANLMALREHEQASDYVATLRQAYHKKQQNNDSSHESMLENNDTISLITRPRNTSHEMDQFQFSFLLNNPSLLFLIHMIIRRRIHGSVLNDDKKNQRDGDRPCCFAIHLLTLALHKILIFKQDDNIMSEDKMLDDEVHKSFVHFSINKLSNTQMKKDVIQSFFQWLIGSPSSSSSPLWLLGRLWVECSVDKAAFPSLHRMGLNWLLNTIGEVNSEASVVLRNLADANNNAPIPGAAKPTHQEQADTAAASKSDKGGMSMAERRAAAQKRAMEAMKKSQAAFSQHMEATPLDKKNKSTPSDVSDDIDSEEDDDGENEHGLHCVICRSATSEGRGGLAYIAFSQRSTVLSNAITHHNYKGDGEGIGLSNRWPKELEDYVVVSPTGCQLDELESLGSHAITVLAKGSLLGPLLQVKGNRAQVTLSLSQRGGLGETRLVTGWISIKTDKGRQQVSALRHQHSWQRWGRSRMHVTSCGHGVHLPCWDAYFARVLSAPSRGEFESAFHDRREFHCPLCKAISNLLIPHYQPLDDINEYNVPFEPSMNFVHSNAGDDVNSNSAEIATEEKQSKFQKIESIKSSDLIVNLIEWKKEDGIYYNNKTQGDEYFNQLLTSKMNKDEHLNDLFSFYQLPCILTSNDINNVSIFKDMLCETAITNNHLTVANMKLQNPLFQVHEVYSTLAYTLQTLEMASRDCLQFPKSGLGCDADSLLSFMGLLQRISVTSCVRPFGCALRERLNGSIATLFKLTMPQPLAPQGTGGSTIGIGDPVSKAGDVLMHSQFNVTDDGHVGVEGGAGEVVGLSLAGDGFPCPAVDMMRKTIEKEFKEVEQSDNSLKMQHEALLWACWAQPVLCWDLHTFSIAVLTTMVPPCSLHLSQSPTMAKCLERDRLKLLKLLTLLRLSQILMEPGVTGVSPDGPQEPSQIHDDDDALSCLRLKLSQLMNYQIDPSQSLYGPPLLVSVQEKLAPFMVYLLTLNKLLSSSSNDRDNADRLWSVLSLDRDDVDVLLEMVGLPPSLSDIAQHSELFDHVIGPWATQFAAFYQPQVPSSTSVSMLHKCGACGKIDRCLKCMGCFELQYCSRECQKAHWVTDHKRVCVTLSKTGIKTAGWGGPNYLSPFSGFSHPTSSSTSTDPSISKIPNRNAFVSDYSHFSTSLNINPTLFKLPHNYHDLFPMVAPHLDQLALDVKSSKTSSSSAAEEKQIPEVAICLITGTILPAGAKLDGSRKHIGALTLHAAHCCDGAGLFFLVRKCSVLAIRGEHAAQLQTPYLDQWGEEDEGFKRGRPLSLDPNRWETLLNYYKFHRISHQVSAVRSSRDTVIRSYYY